MDTKSAYNSWAEQYDTNENKTRDIEAIALRKIMADMTFENCLEIGCGTGKNTEWLLTITGSMVAVDFSDEMLAKARNKIQSEKVKFTQADINNEWNFAENHQFDLVTFSLVLEHIENLETIFKKLSRVVKPNGYVYIGELHPFKQYNGTKARFETENGLQTLACYNHNISDFINAAKCHGFLIVTLEEFFDDNDRANIPRILTLVFRRPGK